MANDGLPTSEEIACLSRWAKVAFAARCARQAQSRWASQWPGELQKQLTAAEYATSVAEHVATAAAYDAVADVARKAGVRAVQAGIDTSDTSGAVSRAAATAILAAAAAARIGYDFAATYANSAADFAASAGVDVVRIRSDYELLLFLGQRDKWTDATPVPPSVFSPLHAKPAITAEELAEDETIRVKVCFLGKPGTTAAELAPHIRATYRALNEYTLAKYGKHLKLADFKRLVLQYAGVSA